MEDDQQESHSIDKEAIKLLSCKKKRIPFNVQVIFGASLCAVEERFAEHGIRSRYENVLQAVAGLYNQQELVSEQDGHNKHTRRYNRQPTAANTAATANTAPTTASPSTRLLEAIKEAYYEPTAQETHNDTHTQVRPQRDTWWNHIVATPFLGDEARMFRELRIG